MCSRALLMPLLLTLLQLFCFALITQTLFTMLVLMAVVTTLMAVPLFNLVYGRSGRPEGVALPA